MKETKSWVDFIKVYSTLWRIFAAIFFQVGYTLY